MAIKIGISSETRNPSGGKIKLYATEEGLNVVFPPGEPELVLSGTGLRGINVVTEDYTIQNIDPGKLLLINSTSTEPVVITIPNNTTIPIKVGTRIEIGTINSANISVATESGVTLLGANTVNGAFNLNTLYKIDDNTWLMPLGDGAIDPTPPPEPVVIFSEDFEDWSV